MPEKMTDHNGFAIDAIPPRLGELRPLSEYKSAPTRITGLDPLTGKTITVVAHNIASGPNLDYRKSFVSPDDGADESKKKRKERLAREDAESKKRVPFTFAEKPGVPRPERRVSPKATAVALEEYGEDMGEMFEAARIRTQK